jgi:BolA family transcriptional regulator, general stress-responsive regulator
MRQLWVAAGKKQAKLLLDIDTLLSLGPSMRISDTMRDKLTAAFAPSLLVIQDDSSRHAGHSGATRTDGSQGETHFSVRIVSAQFAGLSRVERQRRVYDVLSQELSDQVHALSLTALSPAETARR